MIHERLFLEERFSELFGWERAKRRERFLVTVFFYSVLVSLIAFSVKELLPSWISPLSLVPLLFAALVPGFFLLHPWGKKESLRILFLLDKTLQLEERAITAWEILRRKEKRPAELLVLKEAEGKLNSFDPRPLFRRHYSWQMLLAPPLFLFWLLFVWFDLGIHPGKVIGPSQYSLAHRVKQFSHDLIERARTHGLSESMKTAQALEEVAERRLRGKIEEKELTKGLAAMVGKIVDRKGTTGNESDPILSSPRKDGLLDLKAELETLSSTLPPGSSKWEHGLGSDISGKIDALPRLKGEIERALRSAEKLDEEELGSFLEKLEKAVTAELDRLTLQEIREFLDPLLGGNEGKQQGESTLEAFQAGQGDLSQAQKARGKGLVPGDQLGMKGETAEIPPTKASAATHLKGLLGEGKSSSLRFRGEPSSRWSTISEQEIITSYQRQAEEELALERIPEGLKDAIKKYFLSLGMTEGKKAE